ncbi:MAG: amidohydrolase family protein [Thermomicrobiales bacterium]|nr:amidohydrolase family protein [Thermomicrobiales bacterium]
MPPATILDSHVHLWDTDRFRIPWLDDIPMLNQPMGLDDYAAATDGLPVDGLVYLQVEVAPPYALTEARQLATLAASNSIIQGIVPWAPLEFGDRCRLFLEELVSISPLIKGVRRIVQGEPDPGFCLQPDFIRGAQLLAEFGLSSDLCCNWRQLGQNVELVGKCPDTLFILDHIAKPDIRENAFEPWASQITALGAFENCYCKISGVLTEADHQAWEIDQVKPYVMHALEAFGEDRVVFGSDWPVVTQAASYKRWVEVLDDMTAGFSNEAKTKLWSTNGRRFYRLDQPA